MVQQNLDFGTAADNDGEDFFSAFTKIQENFSDLYATKQPLNSNLTVIGANVTAETSSEGLSISTEELGYWTNTGSGVSIWRLADRVFVGEAVNATGEFHADASGQGSILDSDSDGPSYLALHAALLSYPANGGYAVVGYSRASDQSSTTSSIGVAGGVLNNKASASCWALYADATHVSGSITHGLEIAAKNQGSDLVRNSYNLGTSGGIHGLWLAGGGDSATGGAATNPSVAAIGIIKNGHTWNSGLVFRYDAITGTDGVTGTGEAISLAKGHQLNWYYAGGNLGFQLWSDVAASTDVQSIVVNSNGMLFRNDNSLALVRIAKVSGTITGRVCIAGSTSAEPGLIAEGTATDVDLVFTPKGTGLVRFGTHAAIGAETVTGYITIKDAAGNSRKLAVVSGP